MSNHRSFSSSDQIENNDDPLQKLLRNNKAWVENINSQDPEFFKAVGATHRPKYLYFGCSDAVRKISLKYSHYDALVY